MPGRHPDFDLAPEDTVVAHARVPELDPLGSRRSTQGSRQGRLVVRRFRGKPDGAAIQVLSFFSISARGRILPLHCLRRCHRR